MGGSDFFVMDYCVFWELPMFLLERRCAMGFVCVIFISFTSSEKESDETSHLEAMRLAHYQSYSLL